MSPLFQHAFLPQDNGFNTLFRFLDEFDSYSREANPRAKLAHCRPAVRLPSFTPRFDVRETETTYELHGELPGIEKKDLSIDFNDQNVTIHGRVQRNYTAGTPPAGLPVENHNNETQLEDNDTVLVEAASHKATVTDEAEQEALETSSTTSSSGRTTPAETVKEGVVAPAPVPKKPVEKYWHQERSIGEFHRTFSFATRINDSGAVAKLENGVLHVTIPKAAKPVSKRIAIN